MTQINLFMNSAPRDLIEFIFLTAVGFTAGSFGLIQQQNLDTLSLLSKITYKRKKNLQRLEEINYLNFTLKISPNEPAVKPTAVRNMNSIKSLGAEFINELI